MTSGFSIRPLANREEAQACARLMSTSEPWLTLGRGFDACVAILLNPTKEVLVAANGPAIDGFVIIDLNGAFVGYLQTIGVRAEARGKGVGTALIRAAEERIFQRGPNVFICVSAFNTGARRLYERLGYETVGTLKDYLVAGYDEILLRKSIGPWSGFQPA
jgi:ribosomal-protein-alanine N-acetyltransferase